MCDVFTVDILQFVDGKVKKSWHVSKARDVKRIIDELGLRLDFPTDIDLDACLCQFTIDFKNSFLGSMIYRHIDACEDVRVSCG